MVKPITQENSRLGFVGIGYMGRPIARRLLESGFKLTAYDQGSQQGRGTNPIWRHRREQRLGTFLELQCRVVLPTER